MVGQYNKYMGRVDLCDRMVSYYRFSSRTNKWQVRVLHHFIALALQNAWLLYRLDSIKGNKPYDQLIHFRFHVAECLVEDPQRSTEGIFSNVKMIKMKINWSSRLNEEKDALCHADQKGNRMQSIFLALTRC